ncbi:hypothetical protein CQW23_31961 [Capsicum baccatum]|uniref:F-box domain-containing protein n=1 Tax=Capsicum baccatum TaxID=33114 RepID=A0A2G2V6B3_CAPBA|nr:hypothetical protein CQW23_31961 [Capsicum baccatum]
MKHSVPLQEEIIMEILSRLPVRSLLRFKCVSKCWMTLISEPYFTLKHRNCAKNDQNSQKFLVSRKDLLEKEFSLYCSSLSSVHRIEEVQKLDCPSNGVHNYPDKDFMLLLWNPSTRESVVLSNRKFSQEVTCTWGLGYDSTSDDILKINDCIDAPSNMGYLAFVHGAFHWVDSLLNQSVVTFSISDEVYREIPLPEGLDLVFDIMHSKQGALVLGGMLCVYSTSIHHREYTFKLWVMNEYGVKESWNQLFTIRSTDLYSITPKYMFSDGEVLLRCSQLRRSGSVFKTSNESPGVWPRSDSECIQDGFIYTESLISPKLLTWY